MYKFSKKQFSMFAILVIAALALAACQPAAATQAPTQPPTQVMPTAADTAAPTANSVPLTGSDVTPSVSVSDQAVTDGAVTIDQVSSPGPGWMVIHADNGGKPGAVIGHTQLQAGENDNVVVQVDASKVTPTLYAMLHADEGVQGAYEFPGPDIPVLLDGQMVSPAFQVSNAGAVGSASTNDLYGSSTPAAQAGSADQVMVAVGQTDELGSFLVDGQGLSLYHFLKDEPDKSNCDASCQNRWPPLLTTGAPAASAGVDASKLGTIPFDGDQKQVTYDHMPLYHWHTDEKPGDTFGQGIGEVWFVVEAGQQAAQPSAVQPDNSSPAAAQQANLHEEAELYVSQTADLGTFLVDSQGMTLYFFTRDEPNKSNCDIDCMVKWPPLLTQQAPKADDGVDAGKLSAIAYKDGYQQVTYDGMPLYYWYQDKAPGDTKGHGVGDVWFVVQP